MKFRIKEELIENGKILFDKHCGDKKFPLYFLNTYLNDDNSHVGLISSDAYKYYGEPGHEAVCDALTSLESEPVLVLQGITISNDQFEMWTTVNDSSEKLLNSANQDSSTVVLSTDFMVFGPNYIVLIDIVKNSADNAYNAELESLILEKLRKQRKMKKLIWRVGQSNQPSGETRETHPHFKVLRYIAFSRGSNRREISILEETKNEGERVEVLNEAAFHVFQEWWDMNILESQPDHGENMRGDFEIIRQTLFYLGYAKVLTTSTRKLDGTSNESATHTNPEQLDLSLD